MENYQVDIFKRFSQCGPRHIDECKQEHTPNRAGMLYSHLFATCVGERRHYPHL